jgi:hypothetical protein
MTGHWLLFLLGLVRCVSSDATYLSGKHLIVGVQVCVGFYHLNMKTQN